MTGSDSRGDGGVDRIGYSTDGASEVRPQRPHRPALELSVVRRAGRPDRATIHPPGLTGVARMETWLSVDNAAVVDCAAWR